MPRSATLLAGGIFSLGATLIAVTSSLLVSGATGSTTSSKHETTTIHIIDTDAKVAIHDLNHNGRPDFGDIVVFRSVDTTPRGKTLGHGIGQVDIQGPHNNLLTFTLVLTHGNITMQGDIRGLAPGARSRIAVTGGTGRYANAHGVTTARQIGEGTTDLVIRLHR